VIAVLVVGGALLAPLNLLIVRSLTVYDLLIGLAFLMLAHRRALRMPARHYQLVCYVFVVAALLSAFRATYASEALTQILQYLFVFFVQVPTVVSVVRTRRLALWSVALLCVGTLAAILHAYITHPTQGAGRVLVFYSDNPNRLGYPVVYLLPMLFVLWHASRRRGLVAVPVLGSAYLCIWALFASGSRSSVLGSVVSVLVFFVARPRLRLRTMLVRVLVLAAVVGVVGVGLATAGALPTTLEDRVNRSLDSDPEDQHGLVGDREALVVAGLRASVASPWIGSGLDNFRYVTTDYYLGATPQLPHNLWLQLMVQVGAIGTLALGLYLLFWASDLVRGYRHAGPRDRHLLWSLFASMSGILTIFLFAPEMLDRHYWLIFALGLAVVEGSLRGGRPPSPRLEEARR
jgi:hypothetical protein